MDETPSTVPQPLIKRRIISQLAYDELLEKGLDPLVARVAAARPLEPCQDSFLAALQPTLKQLSPPKALADIEVAVSRLTDAIIQKQTIALETDHDCDGQTSHAVLYTALCHYFNHPKENILSYIGHRLKEGYGLSDKLCDRILGAEKLPDLVITADNGSADEPRIARLKAQGIDCIVTDHHEIPLEGIPASAVAVLNPTREDCDFPDPYIAGCMVAWLLVAATRQRLVEIGHLKDKSEAPIVQLLDFVAVGTVADCVSMAKSVNNRAVVQIGLQLMGAKTRPCWRSLEDQLSTPVTSEDLGFKVGPLLNSDGRLDSAHQAVSFLLTQTVEEAHKWVLHLTEQNTQRKAIQKTITKKAMRSAAKQAAFGKKSICVFLEDGHPGVHGITASRVKDAFGRPTILLAPKMGQTDVVTGSARSIDGLHLKQLLEGIALESPSMLLAYGGHQGAAGLTLERDKVPAFIKIFENHVAALEDSIHFGPVLYTDGLIEAEDLTREMASKLSEQLAPFGREFESPVFEAHGTVMTIQPVGDGTHLKLMLHIGQQSVSCIWFGARENENVPLPVNPGERVHCAFALKNNAFRGKVTLNLQIQYCSPITQMAEV